MEITSLVTAIQAGEIELQTHSQVHTTHSHTHVKLIRWGEVGKVDRMKPKIETVGMRLKIMQSKQANPIKNIQ